MSERRPDQTRQVPFNVPKCNPKKHFKHQGRLSPILTRTDKTSAFQRAQTQSEKALQTPRRSLAHPDQTRQDKSLSTCPNTIQKGTSNTKGFSRPSRPDQTRQVPFNVPKHNPKRHFKHQGLLSPILAHPDQTRQVPFNVPKHNPKKHFKHKRVLITSPIFEDKTQEQKRSPDKVFQRPLEPIFSSVSRGRSLKKLMSGALENQGGGG